MEKRRPPQRMRGSRVIAVAAAALMAWSCTDDGEGKADGEQQIAPDGMELADRLGCDSTARGLKKGWDVERPVECFADEGWTATIHAPLSPGSRSTALTLLRSRYGAPLNPCPDGPYPNDVSVIAGEAWVVVVSRDDGADRVMERVGGELQPGDGPGPPISYFALPCPRTPTSGGAASSSPTDP
jgi:hypothetical protein